VFESQHLAYVLNAAFKSSNPDVVASTAIKQFLSAVKAKSDTFKGVYTSKRINGMDVPSSTVAIAESIAKCTMESVENAQELLYWLVEKKLLFKSHLQGAMNKLEPRIKFRQADRTNVLLQNIVESMSGGLADSFHAEVLLNSAAGGYSKESELLVVGDASSQASNKNPETEDKEHACSSKTEQTQEPPEDAQLKAKSEPSEMDDKLHDSQIGPGGVGGQIARGAERPEHDAVGARALKKTKVEGGKAASASALDSAFGGISRDSITPAKCMLDAALPLGVQLQMRSSKVGGFESEHIACVLSAAITTMKDMKSFVAYVKTKSDVFKVGVPLSSKSTGTYNKVQLAKRIAECRPVGVTNAYELLSWLVVSLVT